MIFLHRHLASLLALIPSLSLDCTKLFQQQFTFYDKLRTRNVYLDQYKKEAIFAEGLDEFDSAREVVASLVTEYKAMA